MRHDIFSMTYNILNTKQKRRKHNFDMDVGINLGQVTINNMKTSAIYWLKFHFPITYKTNGNRGYFKKNLSFSTTFTMVCILHIKLTSANLFQSINKLILVSIMYRRPTMGAISFNFFKI